MKIFLIVYLCLGFAWSGWLWGTSPMLRRRLLAIDPLALLLFAVYVAIWPIVFFVNIAVAAIGTLLFKKRIEKHVEGLRDKGIID